MVQHHVIYSPEKKLNSGHNQNTCNHTHIKYIQTQSSGCSLCSRRSSSIMSEWAVLLHLSRSCPCLSWASTAYLPPSQASWARLHPFPQTGPISLRIQATACFHVMHSYDKKKFYSEPFQTGDIKYEGRIDQIKDLRRDVMNKGRFQQSGS